MYTGEWRIADFDPDLAKAIAQEEQRQEDNVELIASENYVSPRVMEAQGSVLPKAIRAGVTTAGVNTSMSPKHWRSSDHANYLKRIIRTCSRIPALRPMQPCIWRC